MDNKEKFYNILTAYFQHASLREVERTGWVKWNVSGRRESVLDHVSDAQHLALLLYSEFEELADINIEHVIVMLSVHEEAESAIGDITPYDGISEEEKAKMEKEAFIAHFQSFKRSGYFISLFDEFEARETKEAKFAYLCDKLDADLQANYYSSQKRCSIANATYEIVSHPEAQKIISDGAKTVWDVFYEADKAKYEGTFLEEFFTFLKDTRL